MINKSKVGGRILYLRKTMGYSQTAFAEKLNVSAQAVSKWETGQSLPDIEISLDISRLAGVSINEMLEGRDVIGGIASRPFIMQDSIALFVPPEEKSGNIEWAKEIVSGNWTKRNWESAKAKHGDFFKKLAGRIINHGGLTLEIGTGPGGGYMTHVLLEKPGAEIIVSDLSPTVVREWKKVLDAELNPPNVYCAALDNCDLPFKDNSVDVISSGGGFGNTEGDKFKALTEIYRVLKPGGLYLSGEGYVTQETLRALPGYAQKVLLEKRPDIFEDFYDASVTAGFKTIDNQICNGWSTKGDRSDIADLAEELGIEIWFSTYIRYCIK